MTVKVEINAKTLKNRNIRTTSDFIERQQMKLMLSGALIVLGVMKLSEINQTNPAVGIPVTIVLTSAWMVELFRELKKARR
jgi:hypothetical protein